MRIVLIALLLTGCFREAEPCTVADYDRVADTCENCAVEIEAHREGCEKLIRKDAE
jgi:hypothetical protein